MPKVDNTARSLLLNLGIGDFNATGIIPYMFMAPAQLDTDMAATILLVEALQKTLNGMGARLEVNGDLDVATVVELRKVVGPNWLPMKWYEIVRRVVRAKHHGFRIIPGQAPAARAVNVADEDYVKTQADDGMGMFESTGSKVGLAAGVGVLLWALFGGKKRQARSRS